MNRRLQHQERRKFERELLQADARRAHRLASRRASAATSLRHAAELGRALGVDADAANAAEGAEGGAMDSPAAAAWAEVVAARKAEAARKKAQQDAEALRWLTRCAENAREQEEAIDFLSSLARAAQQPPASAAAAAAAAAASASVSASASTSTSTSTPDQPLPLPLPLVVASPSGEDVSAQGTRYRGGHRISGQAHVVDMVIAPRAAVVSATRVVDADLATGIINTDDVPVDDVETCSAKEIAIAVVPHLTREGHRLVFNPPEEEEEDEDDEDDEDDEGEDVDNDEAGRGSDE